MANSVFDSIDAIEGPKTVLSRVDLNSPVEDGTVMDNRRFTRHAETVRDLASADHRVALLAHQGRPGRDDFVTLEAHAEILADHINRPVGYCPHTVGADAQEAVSALDSGEVLLLENVRMNEAELADRTPEEHAKSRFVTDLVAMGDVYVGDAYSTAHRSHASIVGVPAAMDEVFAGRVMVAEYTANSAIQSRTFDGRVTMVLGGTKADDLVRVMRGVEDTVDRFLLGGVIGELALRARGHDVGYDVDGTDLFDPIWAEHEETIRGLLERYDDRLVLPVDLAYADDDGERAERSVRTIRKDRQYLDVGSDTIERYASHIDGSAAVFVKGALGVFEDERFSDGTIGVLQAIGNTNAFSVIGGGDTSRAIDLYGFDPDDFDHISIAGGAYVRALAGESLPGVEVLRRSSV